jgi:hypothetical protein
MKKIWKKRRKVCRTALLSTRNWLRCSVREPASCFRMHYINKVWGKRFLFKAKFIIYPRRGLKRGTSSLEGKVPVGDQSGDGMVYRACHTVPPGFHPLKRGIVIRGSGGCLEPTKRSSRKKRTKVLAKQTGRQIKWNAGTTV